MHDHEPTLSTLESVLLALGFAGAGWAVFIHACIYLVRFIEGN